MIPFFDNAAPPWTELGDGIRHKIVGHTPELMPALLRFDLGAIGKVHAHDEYEPIAYLLSGEFEADTGGVKKMQYVGSAVVVPRLTAEDAVWLAADGSVLGQLPTRREDCH